MADGSLTRPAPAPSGSRGDAWRRLPVAARIAAIYLAARLVTTGFLLLAARASTAESRFGESPSLGDFVLGWDAQWYWSVAVFGYPAVPPTSDSGDIAENAWAFMPVYAHVANAVGLGSWGAGALAVSLASGYLACLVLYRLLRLRQDESASLWAVAFFASAPVAAMFQVGYAESLFLLLLFCALLCVALRRWWWLYGVIPVLAFTRPGVLALALMLGLYGIWRWRRRAVDPLPGAEIAHIVALGALATAVGFAWQLIAGAVTGNPQAYLETELAWRRAWSDAFGVFVPFEGWVEAAGIWFRLWGMPAWMGYAALVLLVAAVVGMFFAPPVRRLGIEVRLWAASYLLYLFAVFFPQSSTFRLLLPLSPLWGAVAAPRSRALRVSVLALCLLGQAVWIAAMYGSGNRFWQIP
ncbi:hypothetical protein [Microbacterium album]|uniref:Uncharacterized protein n=1 Tax=Microbacterium album TaxID=2053191 RepID=A0A917MNH4_9MICO|nr:hypothetical protein [Microbacterium album]GGH49629.1 hypothetical protein GCM10010921_27880 [Microbacterium album]